MPLFEYECRDCGHHFEALVIGARTPACPKCKSQNLEKKVSALGFAGGSNRSAGCGSSGGG